MPRIQAIATATPPHKIEQSQAKAFASRLFESRLADLERLLPLFDNTGIQTRYFSVPPEWFGKDNSLAEKNKIYLHTATELGAKAARILFERSDTAPVDIDSIIYINTTGLATPSIDARLVNVLGLRSDIRRTPIWGLGCAGGAAGLAHAYHYLLGHPTHRVLVVAVELCGLTFIHDDYSKSNLVACALFGEGAAAALVCGDEVETSGPQIIATQSTFYPDSLEVMGWDIVSRGMQVVFNKRIPEIVKAVAAEELESFLSRHRLNKNEISHYLYHPGGLKIIEAYEAVYQVNRNCFVLSREILRDYGNMSSVTVLFVIERFLAQIKKGDSGHALISALGPGFCSETLLVRF